MFRIITCNYNYDLSRNIESIRKQTYPDWEHYILPDGDGCERVGAAYLIFATINNNRYVWGDEDIVCMVDGDDYLEHNALSVVNSVYNKDIWLTYGSYRTVSGREPKFTGAYVYGDNYRKAPWRGTHLKTFRFKLAKQLRAEDFIGPGGWLSVCSDMALMYPMLEIAGHERIRYINNRIYVYNDLNPISDHKTQGRWQKRVERYLRRKKGRKQCERL